jgi:hypothetical protein
MVKIKAAAFVEKKYFDIVLPPKELYPKSLTRNSSVIFFDTLSIPSGKHNEVKLREEIEMHNFMLKQ